MLKFQVSLKKGGESIPSTHTATPLVKKGEVSEKAHRNDSLVTANVLTSEPHDIYDEVALTEFTSRQDINNIESGIRLTKHDNIPEKLLMEKPITDVIGVDLVESTTNSQKSIISQAVTFKVRESRKYHYLHLFGSFCLGIIITVICTIIYVFFAGGDNGEVDCFQTPISTIISTVTTPITTVTTPITTATTPITTVTTPSTITGSFLCDNCNDNAYCELINDEYQCVCNERYQGDGYVCKEIHACEYCDENAYCKKLNDQYKCTCDAGYQGDGFTCEGAETMILIGGYDRFGRCLNDVDGMTTKTVCNLPKLPESRRSANSATLNDSIIIVCGGHDCSGPVFTCWFINIKVSNTWISLPDMPFRAEECAFSSINDRFYMFGGYGENGPQKDVMFFSFSNSSWQYASPKAMTSARYGHCAVTIDDTIVLIGGSDNQLTTQSSKMQGDEWQTLQSTIVQRIEHSCITSVFKNKLSIIVVGGRISPHTVEYLQWVDKNSGWILLPSDLIYPRSYYPAVQTLDSIIIVAGGNKEVDYIEYWDDIYTTKWNITRYHLLKGLERSTCIKMKNYACYTDVISDGM